MGVRTRGVNDIFGNHGWALFVLIAIAMANHVHLIAIRGKDDVVARALKETHGRFASYWNALQHSTGHVWQGGTIPVLWMKFYPGAFLATDAPFASAVDVTYHCGNPNINHD